MNVRDQLERLVDELKDETAKSDFGAAIDALDEAELPACAHARDP
jgi:hypothetical protein